MMLTEIKLLSDIAKALKLPVWLISHGIVIIIAVSGTLVLRGTFVDKNQKIESVPELKKSIQNLTGKVDTLNYRLCKINDGMVTIGQVIRQKNRIDSAKFSKVLKDRDYFQLMDEWFLRLQNTMPISKFEQKKNLDVTQLN